VKTFLDTHAAVLLYAGEIDTFGARSKALMERSALFVSPFVRLELKMLYEIGRIKEPSDSILGALEREIGVSASRDTTEEVVGYAPELDWTRDPFDRLLVATALLHKSPIISRDRRIQDNYPNAVW
jgi:PIN domain nuclease of toxin-antitoxin system